MIRFEDVGQAKIRCGLPKGRTRVDFAFPLGWAPYVCCDETVIQVRSFDDLRRHIELLSNDPVARKKFCRFLDTANLLCTHENTAIVESSISGKDTPS